MGKIRQNDEVYKQMLAALQKNDLKGVEDLIANNNFKSGFGSAVLKFSKIPYSSSNDLVEKAIRFRLSLGVGKGPNVRSGSNVAVCEYIKKNGEHAYIMKMASKGKHAEEKIIDELNNINVPFKNVRRLYSELDSCTNCTREILEKLKFIKGFYSFELNDKGKELWKINISKLYNYLWNNK